MSESEETIELRLGTTARDARARGLVLPSSIPQQAELVGQGADARGSLERAHRRRILRMAEDGTWWAWRPKR